MLKPIEKLNDITKKHTVFYDEARDTFEKQLDVDVNPQLKKIDFYGKHIAPQYDYTPEAVTDRDDDDGGVSVGSLVDLRDLLELFEKGHITFVGGAGYGKTTLLKAISRGALDGRYMKNVNAIHYIQCAHYLPNRLITARELLFGSTLKDLSDEEVTQIIEDVKSNPDGFVFVLDSLDSLQYDLDGVYEYINDLDVKANPEAILWNFFAGNLFPGSRIITSSREHSIRNYKGEVRPQEVVALTGLTKDSIKEIIVGYLGEKEGNETMQYLKSECPDQLAYCSTPVLLVYTLVALQDGSAKPSTISGITVAVLQSIMRSGHVAKEKSSEEVLEIFNKLKVLAHNGCTEGKVHFAERDFQRVGLDRSDAVSISIITPRGGRGSILQGNDLLFFSHQSLQEMLSALFICEMNLVDFTKFVAENLGKPRFLVVRKSLCGVLMDDDLFQQAEPMLIHEITNVEEKRKILRDFFTKELRRPNLEGADLLEIILSLHECREGIDAVIKENLYQINLENSPLSPGDCHALGSVISRCKDFYDLDIQKCGINDESINILASALEKSILKNYELWIGLNTDLGVEGYSTMGRWCKNCVIDKLHLYRSDMKPDQLDALLGTMENNKISLLVLHGNTNMGIRGMKTIKKMAAQCGLEKLDMQNCRLTTAQLQELSNMPPNTKFHTLRLNEKRTVSKEDFQALAKLLPRVTDTLSLFGWKISNEELQMLETEKPDDLKIDMKGPHAGGVEESEGYINPLGFQMKIGTCRVRFPRNTVEKPTFFQVLATNNPENEPEKYFAITPRIACNPSTVFNAPMAVKLPTWCGTDSGDVIASIMYKDEESGGPCNVLEHKLLRDYRKKIAFQSLYHTYFWVAIDEASLDKVYFSSHVSLYHNNHGNFKAVLYTGGTPDVNAELEKEGFSLIAIDFETQKIFLNDKLKFRVSGDSKFEGFFPLGKDFAKKRRSALEFKLLSPSHSIRKLKVILQLSEDNPIKANLLWTKQGPQLQISQEIETFQHDAPETGYSDVSILEGLSFKNSIEMQLGQQGGQISLDGNKIVFPPGALEQETKITLSVDSDSENWPPEYIFISTILGCDLSGAALSKPALVEIETWCTAEEEDVLILKKEDDNSEWKVEKTAKLGLSGFITFETKTFSLWGIAESFLHRSLNIDYRFTNLVYRNAGATFNSIVCRDNETIINAIRIRLESNPPNMINILPFESKFRFPPSEEITGFIAITCYEPGNSVFKNGDSLENPIVLNFSINQVRRQNFEKTFVLTSKPKADCSHIELRYQLSGARDEIDNTFTNDWTFVTKQPNPDPDSPRFHILHQHIERQINLPGCDIQHLNLNEG